MKTKVIFRKWKNGETIALFPEDLGTNNPYTCSSYASCGQHSAANPDLVIQNTKPANSFDYAHLKFELENLGYELDIRVRNRYSFYQTRKKLLKEINGNN